MLLNIFAFSLFIAAACGTGELTVLQSPSSILFVGKRPLESSIIGDVVLATMGHDVRAAVNWPGLVIKDPFKLAQTTVIIIHVRGILKLPLTNSYKTYELSQSQAEWSYNNLVTHQNATGNETVHDINFAFHATGVAAFRNCFGELVEPVAVPCKNLKPLEYMSHRHVLDSIGYLHAAAQNLENLLKPSHVLIIRISLDRLAKVAEFSALYEVKNMIATGIRKLLNAAKNRSSSLLFLQTTDKRLLRTATGEHVGGITPDNPFRDTIKGSDFPIIFSIVVWFTLGFVLSLAASSYKIATIDPGKDSVLYRVSNIQHQLHHGHHKKHT